VKISLNMLKAYTALPDISVKELSDRLTEAACEVEKVTVINRHLHSIVAVKVTGIEKHPAADSLKIVKFSDGNRDLNVVCGAPNVRIGMITAFAGVGTELPGGLTLQAKSIRGVESSGMLCSERELGLGDSHEGIIELPDGTVCGTPLNVLLEKEEDVVFEIDNKSITHRSDLWAIEGMARETAALFNISYREPFPAERLTAIKNLFSNDEKPPVTLTVHENTACMGYAGYSVSNVSTAVPSPLWLKEQLIIADIRPVNVLVDISNYVMIELGIPTHFFDREAIAGGRIIVQKLSGDVLFTTLDGKDRLLSAGDTVVADAEKPLVIAGVMGGESSMVNESTTRLFVEAAVWRADEVRKTSLRLGLRTDSSIRYEKSLDPMRIERTLLRTAELIKEIFPEARFEGGIQTSNITPFQPYTVNINIKRFNRVMGLAVSAEEAEAILSRLGFTARKTGPEGLQVGVPSWRSTKEALGEADIYEEIGRIYGYRHITPVPPLWPLAGEAAGRVFTFERRLQDFFVLNGQAYEIFTHPMLGRKLLEECQWPDSGEALKLANALSPDYDRMRPALTPSFLKTAELNQKNFDRFAFFEYGRAFRADSKNFSSDRYTLAVALFDRSRSRFMELVNLFERFFKAAGLKAALADNLENNAYAIDRWAGIHPHEKFGIDTSFGQTGFITSVHPYLLRQLKIKGFLTVAELDLTDIRTTAAAEETVYKTLSKYPVSLFDCTVLVRSSGAAEVLTVLNKAAIPYLQKAELAGVFEIDENVRAVTVRSTLASEEHTLNSEEIKTSEDLIVKFLDNAGFPLKI
jgi:phenylalanyl-tRNA synthetase beta chain